MAVSSCYERPESLAREGDVLEAAAAVRWWRKEQIGMRNDVKRANRAR